MYAILLFEKGDPLHTLFTGADRSPISSIRGNRVNFVVSIDRISNNPSIGLSGPLDEIIPVLRNFVQRYVFSPTQPERPEWITAIDALELAINQKRDELARRMNRRFTGDTHVNS